MASIESNSLYSSLIALDGLLEASGADGSDVDVVLQLITDNIAMHGLRGAILAPMAGWVRYMPLTDTLNALVSGDAPLEHASRFVEALVPTVTDSHIFDNVMLKACRIGAASLVATILSKNGGHVSHECIIHAAALGHVSALRAIFMHAASIPQDLLVIALQHRCSTLRTTFNIDALRLIIDNEHVDVHANSDAALLYASRWANATEIVHALLDAGLRADTCEQALHVHLSTYFVDKATLRRLIATGAIVHAQPSIQPSSTRTVNVFDMSDVSDFKSIDFISMLKNTRRFAFDASGNADENS